MTSNIEADVRSDIRDGAPAGIELLRRDFAERDARIAELEAQLVKARLRADNLSVALDVARREGAAGRDDTVRLGFIEEYVTIIEHMAEGWYLDPRGIQEVWFGTGFRESIAR